MFRDRLNTQKEGSEDFKQILNTAKVLNFIKNQKIILHKNLEMNYEHIWSSTMNELRNLKLQAILLNIYCNL